MSSRDDELDALQRELRAPHIERPEELDVREGAACFLDRKRYCGADCAAYLGDGALPGDRCTFIAAAQNLVQLLVPQVRGGPIEPIAPPSPFAGTPFTGRRP